MESRRDNDIKQRKNLNADTLFSLIRSSFENLKDHRSEKAQIPLADAFMSAFAMFSLKDPSLLVFEARRSDTNLKTIYKVNKNMDFKGGGSIKHSTDKRGPLSPLTFLYNYFPLISKGVNYQG
jgi:hypothetical protein